MKLLTKLFFAVVTVGALASTASADYSKFVGTWKNTDSHAKGIIRLIIYPDGKIRAFGKCSPNPCDFGQTHFTTYAKHVSDNKYHKAGTAYYDFSFKDVILTAHLDSNWKLTLRDYNKFKDHSDRENYWQQNKFRKLTAAEEAVDFQAVEREPEE